MEEDLTKGGGLDGGIGKTGAGQGDPGWVLGACATDLLSDSEKDLETCLHRIADLMAARRVVLWQVEESLSAGIRIRGLMGTAGGVRHICVPFFPGLEKGRFPGSGEEIADATDLPERFCEAAGGRKGLLILPLASEGNLSGQASGFLTLALQHPVIPFGETSVLKDIRRLFSRYLDHRVVFYRMVENEKKYQKLLELIEEGYFELDLSGNLLLFNDAICRIANCSREELMGMNNRDYTTAETAESMYRVFHEMYCTGKPIRIRDYEVILKCGTRKIMEVSSAVMRNDRGVAVGFRGLVRDVTEKVRADEERKKLAIKLQQAQRLEAIGTLAGGIAHDFNNLLMGIQGNVSLILAKTDPDNSFFEHARCIERCVASGADLTKQLLGFARGGKYQVVAVDLNRLIQGSATMFGRTRRDIRVALDLAEELRMVAADRGQMEQVLLNLYVNAWQAMPRGGSLRIGTENLDLDAEEAALHEVKPGPYVRVSVTDTGIGMNEKTRQRIFEPFFTTKEMGRGTGLGLASAFGIVKGHGGYMHVESAVGKGSVFAFVLPASERKRNKETAPCDGGGCRETGEGCILLVDDEAVVLDVTAEMIRTLGYRVIRAGSGREAVTFYENRAAEIDLVVLDVIMPDMGGSETYALLRRVNPDVRVLVSSGYGRNSQVEALIAEGCMGFMQKPYSISQLSRCLHAALQDGFRDAP